MPIEFHGTPPACVAEPSYRWPLAEALEVRKLYVENPDNYALFKKLIAGVFCKRRCLHLQPEDVLTNHFVLPQPSKNGMACVLVESEGGNFAPGAQAIELPNDEKFARGKNKNRGRRNWLMPPEQARLRFYLLPATATLQSSFAHHQDSPSTWWVAIVARFRPELTRREAVLKNVRSDVELPEITDPPTDGEDEDPDAADADMERLMPMTRSLWESWLLSYMVKKARLFGLEDLPDDDDDEDRTVSEVITKKQFQHRITTADREVEAIPGPAAPQFHEAALEPLRWAEAFLPSYFCSLRSLRDLGMKLSDIRDLLNLGASQPFLKADQAKQAKRLTVQRMRDLLAAFVYILNPESRRVFNDLQMDLAPGSDTREVFELLTQFDGHETVPKADLLADAAQLNDWKQQVHEHFSARAPADITAKVHMLCNGPSALTPVLAVLAENELGRVRLRDWCPGLPPFHTAWRTPRFQASHCLRDEQKQNMLERSLGRILRKCRAQFPDIDPQQLLKI